MPKLIINNKVIDNIPLNEYYLEDSEKKRLVFIQHGYLSSKEVGGDYLALTLARNGFFVIAIDAYKHGERIEEPFINGSDIDRYNEFLTVVKKTGLDILRLYRNHYSHFEKFDIVGVSMGGMIAYYLGTKTTKIRKIVPVISTPDFRSFCEYAVTVSSMDSESFFTNEVINYIKSIDPMETIDRLFYESMFILCGSQDKTVPMGPSKLFYEKNKNKNIQFKIYDIDHNVSPEMQHDIYDFLDDK